MSAKRNAGILMVKVKLKLQCIKTVKVIGSYVVCVWAQNNNSILWYGSMGLAVCQYWSVNSRRYSYVTHRLDVYTRIPYAHAYT